MTKPAGFQLTVILLWLFLVAGIVVAFMPLGPVPAGVSTAQAAMFAGKFVGVSAVIEAIIAIPIILFYSKGHNWARWVIMVVSVLRLISALFAFRYLTTIPARAYLGLAEGLFAVYLLYFLNTPPVRAWFEHKPVVAA